MVDIYLLFINSRRAINTYYLVSLISIKLGFTDSTGEKDILHNYSSHMHVLTCKTDTAL